jgi:peptide/nickel transport system substrate-binding protein
MTHRFISVVQSSIDIGDPHICSDSMNRGNIIGAIYEPLASRIGPGVYYPTLASNWAVEPDGLTWLFKLRESVRFHNGEKLTGNDVVATLKRVVDPAIGGAFGTQGTYASYIGDAEFTSPSKYSFQITTKEPMADLLDLLSEMPIAPEDELGNIPNEYIGTGPYILGGTSREEIVLESNRKYWGGRKAMADEVSWLMEDDPIERTEMVANREADIATLIGLEGTKSLVGSNRAKQFSIKSSLCIIFMMNCGTGVCTDARVRQALNYGLDIDEVVKEVKEGAATRLNGYMNPHHFGYNPETEAYPYDPDHARKLLAEAGYGDGMKLTIDIPTRMPDEGLAVGDMMKEHYGKIGVDVEVVSYSDRAAYAEMVRDKVIHDMCCFDSSPISTFRVLREKIHSGHKGPWWEGFHNEEVNGLIDTAQKTFDDKARESIYKQVFQIIRDEAPWVFLYRPTYFYAINKKLGDWTPTARGMVKLA